MIRINLLPFEDRPRPRSLPLPDKVSAIIYLLAFLVVAAGAYSFLAQSWMLKGLEDVHAAQVEEEARLGRQTKAIEKLQLQTALLNDRLMVLRQVEKHRFDNVEWLNAMNGVLPDYLWLKELSTNQGGNRTTLEGVALGYKPVSKLMQSMEDSGHFGGVQLVKAERGPQSGRAMIHFSIVADWGAADSIPVAESDPNGAPRQKSGGKS